MDVLRWAAAQDADGSANAGPGDGRPPKITHRSAKRHPIPSRPKSDIAKRRTRVGTRIRCELRIGSNVRMPSGAHREALIAAVAGGQCLLRRKDSGEADWYPAALVRRWVLPDMDSLSDELSGAALKPSLAGIPEAVHCHWVMTDSPA